MNVLSYISSLLPNETTGAEATSWAPDNSTPRPAEIATAAPLNHWDDDAVGESHDDADVECATTSGGCGSAGSARGRSAADDDAALPMGKLPSDDNDGDNEVPTAAMRRPREASPLPSPSPSPDDDNNNNTAPHHPRRVAVERDEPVDGQGGGGVGGTIRWFDFVLMALLLVGFMAWMAVHMGVQAASTNGDDVASVVGIVIVLIVAVSLLVSVVAVLMASTACSGSRKTLCSRENDDGGDRAADPNKSSADTGSVTSSSSSESIA